MKVLVVGAAGRTGRPTVARAVEDGHEVTAFVHHRPDNGLPGVRLVVGDVLDADAVDAAIDGQDAVIDTVGAAVPWRRTTLETDAVGVVIAAMDRHGVRRLIVTSSVGVGESIASVAPVLRVFLPTFLRGAMRDKDTMEAAVRASALDWVITRPALLKNGTATGRLRAIPAGSSARAGSITRNDLADFLVTQLTQDDHLRTEVTVANG
ncbi:NmrA family transcriptional regulator [Tersicoccus solisilvae]|uniref:NmrA family transcriptional regulator n=1 Tax=Tersicoccus solisilvae TaxID=1882339 RepID=A0ABQ1PHJ0_9MICC|nr:NAD(P)H-binding protein [Tersicoccus solisilvae]GGC97250.1 NmrA family transcriptional regulator [Tersicoccus solisilvae]